MIGKLILYIVATAVVLLLWLLVWWTDRRKKARPEVLNVTDQVTLIGWKRDGAFTAVRAVRTTKDGTTSIEFDPPLLLKPGESLDLHFVIPAGCKPVGKNWRAFPLDKPSKN